MLLTRLVTQSLTRKVINCHLHRFYSVFSQHFRKNTGFFSLFHLHCWVKRRVNWAIMYWRHEGHYCVQKYICRYLSLSLIIYIYICRGRCRCVCIKKERERGNVLFVSVCVRVSVRVRDREKERANTRQMVPLPWL